MKYSYAWLCELSGTKKSPQELADFLTMRAFEVESVESVGFDIDNVVIGQVVELEKHPNADRLRVAQINIGKETLTIVCGAPNIAVGQKVPVARVGTILPGDFEIKQSEIRGVASSGMVCSQNELGLGENHDGIMVLPDAAKIGELLRDFLKDSDSLLDIKVLPDRAHDCVSHVGMAREIAALEGSELDYDYEGLVLPEAEGSDGVSVSIDAKDQSKRYIGALIRNVEVKSSPAWLKNRLRKFGIRSINNVVDVTNYVMLELGQPTHAFDWDLISDEKSEGVIHVRNANKGEMIKLLDEHEYQLEAQDIVIADAQNEPIALAGIMGGLLSGVTDETRAIFLESAHFDAISIRKTRSRLGLRTDASDRFEKDIDASMAERAMSRALEFITHVTGGTVEYVVDTAKEYGHEEAPKVIPVSLEAVSKLLGIEVGLEAIVEPLKKLGFGVEVDRSKTLLHITVPAWRLDIASAEDVVEDIGKVLGYASIPSIAPVVPVQGAQLDRDRSLERELKSAAAAEGFTESLNYSFYSKKDAENSYIGTTDHLELANPMNPDQQLVRASLLPNLLKNVRDNARLQKSVQIFESGKVHYSSEFQSVHESNMFSGIMMTASDDKREPLFLLKGCLENILSSLHMESFSNTMDNAGSYWHPTRTGDIFGRKDGKSYLIGRIGEIHPFVLEAFHIKKRVAYFELDYSLLQEALPEGKQFVPIRRFPEVVRDISLFVPSTVRVKDILDIVLNTKNTLVLNAELFDQYFDKEKNMKSLAFHISFGAADRTLESAEADTLLEAIVEELEKELHVEQRV